jgi:hypothetical protein
MMLLFGWVEKLLTLMDEMLLRGCMLQTNDYTQGGFWQCADLLTKGVEMSEERSGRVGMETQISHVYWEKKLLLSSCFNSSTHSSYMVIECTVSHVSISEPWALCTFQMAYFGVYYFFRAMCVSFVVCAWNLYKEARINIRIRVILWGALDSKVGLIYPFIMSS